MIRWSNVAVCSMAMLTIDRVKCECSAIDRMVDCLPIGGTPAVQEEISEYLTCPQFGMGSSGKLVEVGERKNEDEDDQNEAFGFLGRR